MVLTGVGSMKLLLLLLVALLACVVNGFRAHSAFSRVRKLPMTKIVDGVEFNTIAREWRLKWSANDDKKSLADVQRTLDSFKSDLHKVFGVKSVQRVVCGGCLDYKVIVALDESKFADWVRCQCHHMLF